MTIQPGPDQLNSEQSTSVETSAIGSAYPGKQENDADRNAAEEARRLELEKLRLEIRDLSIPWWFRLPNLAAVASMIVALTGLAWAISNGFFDVARRELEIKKERLLRETAELEKQQAHVQATLKKVQAEVAEARATADRLDRPVVKEQRVNWAPWMRAEQYRAELYVFFYAANAGTTLGTVEMNVDLECGVVITEVGSRLTPRIEYWNETGKVGTSAIRVIVDSAQLERMKSEIKAVVATTPIPLGKPLGVPCERWHLTFQTRMTRADGKSSDWEHFESDEAFDWVMAP